MEDKLFDAKMDFILDADRKEYRYMEEGRHHIIVKAEYNSTVDFLYTRYHYRGGNPLELNYNLEYSGFVHYPTKRIFGCVSLIFDHCDHCVNIPMESLKNEAQQTIFEMVKQRVGNAPPPVTAEAEPVQDDREHFKQYGADEEARKAFFDGIDVIEYIPYISLIPKTEEYIRMVMDMDGYVNDRVDTFLRVNAAKINARLWKNSLVQARLEALIHTPGVHHTTQAIAQCIKDGMKTVTLHLDKDGQRLAVKYEARMLCHANTTDYTIWHMDAPGRRAFEAAFGRQARLYPADILRITYGKNTLYERAEDSK